MYCRVFSAYCRVFQCIAVCFSVLQSVSELAVELIDNYEVMKEILSLAVSLSFSLTLYHALFRSPSFSLPHSLSRSLSRFLSHSLSSSLSHTHALSPLFCTLSLILCLSVARTRVLPLHLLFSCTLCQPSPPLARPPSLSLSIFCIPSPSLSLFLSVAFVSLSRTREGHKQKTREHTKEGLNLLFYLSSLAPCLSRASIDAHTFFLYVFLADENTVIHDVIVDACNTLQHTATHCNTQ